MPSKVSQFLQLPDGPSHDISLGPAEVMEPASKPINMPKPKLGEEEKKQRQKEQMKKWRDEHPDYNKSYRKKYYEENREKILAKRREKRIEQKALVDAARQHQLLTESQAAKKHGVDTTRVRLQEQQKLEKKADDLRRCPAETKRQ